MSLILTTTSANKDRLFLSLRNEKQLLYFKQQKIYQLNQK